MGLSRQKAEFKQCELGLLRALSYLLIPMWQPRPADTISTDVDTVAIRKKETEVNYNFYSLELFARDVQNDRQREALGERRYNKAVRALRTARARVK